MSLIETKNLVIGYKKPLISNLNLNLESSQLVGLIGPNGIGKSTLLRTLAGLQKKIDGDIFFSSKSINKLSSKDRSMLISIVLTEMPTSFNLTVLELLSIGRHPFSGWLGQLRKKDLVMIQRAIDIMEIENIVNKRLFELSDGQLQKVMISRALAQDTDLILMDEPTSHLDLKSKVDILDLLKRITREGKSILMSTHEISLSSNVCDKFWCISPHHQLVIDSPRKLIDSGKLSEMFELREGVL